MKTSYQEPVSALLECGDCNERVYSSVWPDYPKEFGLGTKDIPQLIQMACDKELLNADFEDSRFWAPTHAWRTLGQLRATEAIAPLITLLEDAEEDGESSLEIPEVLGMMGPEAIEPLSHALKEHCSQTSPSIAIANSFYYLAQEYPETRDQCVLALSNQLKCSKDNDSELNSFLVTYLIDLEAVESLEIIRDAFEQGTVDIRISGDLEDVEIRLGVRTERSTPKPEYFSGRFRNFSEIMEQRYEFEQDIPKIGRNDPCICGSGKKYKKCCLQ